MSSFEQTSNEDSIGEYLKFQEKLKKFNATRPPKSSLARRSSYPTSYGEETSQKGDPGARRRSAEYVLKMTDREITELSEKFAIENADRLQRIRNLNENEKIEIFLTRKPMHNYPRLYLQNLI